jgi:signal transduction histidine kinase
MPPEVVMAAWLLPDGKGTELVPRDEDDASYPVIALISPDHAGAVDDVLQAGVWDYVITSEDTLADMPHTADRALRTWRDARQRQHLEQALRRREEQLQQAQKLETIATLARIVVHDFNNRISSILGYSKMALDELLPCSSAQSYLQEVQSAGRLAKEQMQQFLTFCRSSEQPFVRIPLKSLVSDVCLMLQASWPTSVDLQFNVPEGTGLVLANRVQLHHALLYLCSQAGYNTRETGGCLEIRIDTVKADDTLHKQHPELCLGSAYLRMHIGSTHDRGIAEQDKTPPEPLAITKRIYSRTHLELAVVRAIVARHEGIFVVPSSASSAFVIYLPQVTTASPHGSCPPSRV